MKMTERSTVIHDNQLTLMLEGDEDPHNSSVDMLTNFKTTFDSNKNPQKTNLYTTSSYMSNQNMTSLQKVHDRKSDGHIKHNSQKVNEKAKVNHTARNELSPDYENLNELFEEFKEQKLGIKPFSTQNKNSDDMNNKSKLSIEQFMKLKQQKYGDKVQNTLKRDETKEEREKRLFQMIKQKQSVSSC